MISKLCCFLACSLLAASPVLAQQSTFPASWAGTWTIVETEEACETFEELGTTERTVVINEGDPPSVWDSALDFAVAVAIFSDEEFTYTGNSTVIAEGCTTVTTIIYSLEREGNSADGTRGFNVVNLPGGCGADICTGHVITATREGTPTRNTTWGRLKRLYR